MRIVSLLLLACCSLFGELSLKEKIVLGLYHNKILKTNVTLSDGQVAPIYIDLRDVFSFPELSDQITEAYREIAQDLHYDHVCGAPLAGIPLATKLHEKVHAPLLLLRDAPKGHGTKKLLEGRFDPQSKTLLVDDVLFSGSALLKSIEKLQEQGVVVEDAVVLIDKEAGGEQLLQTRYPRLRIHSFMTLNEIKEILALHGLSGSGKERARFNFPEIPLHESYMLERMDPTHREGKYLNSCYQAFKRQEELLGHEWRYSDRFFDWLDAKKEKEAPQVVYLERRFEREKLKVSFEGGYLALRPENTRAQGKLRLMWVMDASGQFYAAPKDRIGVKGKGIFQHSSFFAGQSVAAAGNLVIDPEGRLLEFNNYSGHYRTKGMQFADALSVLKSQGVDLSRLFVSTFHEERALVGLEGKITASEWLELYERSIDKSRARFTHLHEVPSDLIEALRSKVKSPAPTLYQTLYGERDLDRFVKIASQNPVLRQEMLLALALDEETFYPPFYRTERERLDRLRILPLVYGPRVRAHFLNFVSMSLRARSENVRARLEDEKSWDLVIVGGGIHGSLLANRVKAERPTARILVVDREELPSAHFYRGGRYFRINNTLNEPDLGPSFKAAAKYNVPHIYGPVQTTDLTGHRWPAAKVLAETGRITLYNARCDCLFETEVTALSKNEDGSYLLTTNHSDSIRTAKVVFATGLGRPKIPVEDPETANLLKEALYKEEVTDADRILTVEQGFRITPSVAPLSVWHTGCPVDVALVGFGNSALTFLEFLYSLGPDVGYSFDSIQNRKPIKCVVLTGSGVPDVSLKAVSKMMRARYSDIVSPIKEGKIQLIAAHMTRARSLIDGKVEVFYKTLEGEEGSFVAERLVLATGYQSQIDNLLKRGGLNARFEWVLDNAADAAHPIPVAAKLQGEEIYCVGPSAGRDLVDLKTNISGVPITQPGQVDAISFTSVLTEAFAEKLAGGLPDGVQSNLKSLRVIRGQKCLIEGAKALLLTKEESEGMKKAFVAETLTEDLMTELRLELLFLLGRIDFREMPEVQLTFSRENGALMVQGHYLLQEDVEALAQAIKKEKPLTVRLSGVLSPSDTLILSIALDPFEAQQRQLILASAALNLQTHFYKGAYLNTSSSAKMEDFARIFSKYGVKLFFASATEDVEEGILVEQTVLEVGGVQKEWTLDELDSLSGSSARWISTLTQKLDGKLHRYSGVVEGTVVKRRGSEGFGFDACFLPKGSSKTLAEEKPERFNARAKAVEAFMKG